MVWQSRQPACWKTCAPRWADGDIPAVTVVGIGRAEKLGDQGATSPSWTRMPIESADTTTMAIAQGRRQGLRSPWLKTNGKISSTTVRGKPRMKMFSIPGGISANSAKYQRKYQSGRG